MAEPRGSHSPSQGQVESRAREERSSSLSSARDSSPEAPASALASSSLASKKRKAPSTPAEPPKRRAVPRRSTAAAAAAAELGNDTAPTDADAPAPAAAGAKGGPAKYGKRVKAAANKYKPPRIASSDSGGDTGPESGAPSLVAQVVASPLVRPETPSAVGATAFPGAPVYEAEGTPQADARDGGHGTPAPSAVANLDPSPVPSATPTSVALSRTRSNGSTPSSVGPRPRKKPRQSAVPPSLDTDATVAPTTSVENVIGDTAAADQPARKKPRIEASASGGAQPQVGPSTTTTGSQAVAGDPPSAGAGAASGVDGGSRTAGTTNGTPRIGNAGPGARKLPRVGPAAGTAVPTSGSKPARSALPPGTSTPKAAASGFSLTDLVNKVGGKAPQAKPTTPSMAKRPNESRIVKDTAPKKTREELEREWSERKRREKLEREASSTQRLDLLAHVRGLGVFETRFREEARVLQQREIDRYGTAYRLPRLHHIGSIFSFFPRVPDDEEEPVQNGVSS